VQGVGAGMQVRMLARFHTVTLEIDISELVFDIEKIGKNAGLLTKQYDPRRKPLSLTLVAWQLTSVWNQSFHP
jgi:Zn-dependent membrane protease YugP